MLLYLLLIAASPFLISANQQNSNDAVEVVQADGNSPVVYGQSNGKDSEIPPQCNCDVSFEECMMSCIIIAIYDPVCGTDNMNYTSPAELSCAQCCGKDVTIKCRGDCTQCECTTDE